MGFHRSEPAQGAVRGSESCGGEQGAERSPSGTGRGLSARCGRSLREGLRDRSQRGLCAAAELYLTTSRLEYRKPLDIHRDTIASDVFAFSEVLGRITEKMDSPEFTARSEGSRQRSVSARVHAAEREPLRRTLQAPYLGSRMGHTIVWGQTTLSSHGLSRIFFPWNMPSTR